MCIYWNRKVRFFIAEALVDGALCRWLSSTAMELSVAGSHRFTQVKLLFRVLQ
ncbi:hypothetical protein F2Q70_00029800 [Brassica cretica]|uniref:Uncharacterized protein n=1 Tax=Brassica cretica TaxID=69181 RepID=A0A8S9FH95_BRACR|nr:hypothetical protein F2Q70_00029800 [Brassica cretica]KAF2550003.1 hypothetical protein F2Q68_00034268 [Brassica cretica]